MCDAKRVRRHRDTAATCFAGGGSGGNRRGRGVGPRSLGSARSEHRPILAVPPAAPAPAASADQLAVVGYQFGDRSPQAVLRNPDTGRYRSDPARPVAVSPDLGYALTSWLLPPDSKADAPTPSRYRIVDLRTGATLHQWYTENALEAAWSPDGRNVAVTHVTGEFMESRYVDRVDVLDVTTGRTQGLRVPAKQTWRPNRLLTWSTDSRSLYFAAQPGTPGHYRLDLDGTTALVRGGWPSNYYALHVVPGTDTALLVTNPNPQNSARDWLVYDLATGTVTSRFRPAAGIGHNAVVAAPRPDHLTVLNGSTVSVLDARTGATLDTVTLPHATTTVLLAPNTDRGPLTLSR